MAEIFEIRKKHAGMFEALDPYGYSCLAGMGNVHCFVAIEQLVGGDYPVGIAAVSFGEKDTYVLWLYIREEYRAKGIGEKLFGKICELADAKGADKLHVLIPKMGENESYPLNLEYYFYERGFVDAGSYLDEFWLHGDLLGSILQKDDKGPGGAVSLSSLSRQQMQTFADVVRMHFGLPYKGTVYDRDVSCARFDKDGYPLAVALFSKIYGTWFLMGSFAEDEESAGLVLEHALSCLAERMKVNDTIHMLDTGKEIAVALCRLLGNKKGGKVKDLSYDF